VNEVFGLKASLVVTNVPGPREHLSIGGTRLRDVCFWVPHPARLGLGISILSYAGKVIVGVRADEAVTKNPDRLVELFEEEASNMLSPKDRSY
jgi:diacylglycerol O-acyltransferase